MAWTDKGPRAADSSKTAMRQEILLRLTGPVSTPEMGFLSVLLTSSKGGREGGEGDPQYTALVLLYGVERRTMCQTVMAGQVSTAAVMGNQLLRSVQCRPDCRLLW